MLCAICQQWTVQVEPRFHEGASNLEQLVPFEECLQLHSSDSTVVRVPDYLLLTHNGRSFNIVVDPTNLSDGLHYYEIYGTDCKAPWRGPLFRVPVTITKPVILKDRPPVVSFKGISFLSGQIERRFLEVPLGATWAEATMHVSGFDTSRRFFVDTIQICPLKRPIKWESVVTFPSPSLKSFTFPVEGGMTLELAIAQFWSSGIGSHEVTSVDFEIQFHGININKDEVILDGSEAPVRIDAKALLSSEKLVPAAVLNKIRVPYRPVDSNLSSLPTCRDKLPSGKQILALLLVYKFKLEDGAEIKPHVPLLNNRIYDTKFESQFYMISDLNKRVYAMGDVYPKFVKLPKGEYNLQLYIRHENVQYLEKMKQLVLFIERKLDEKEFVRLSFFSQPDGPIMGNGGFKSLILVPGELEAFYVGPPTKDKLPKNCPAGSVLHGTISYGKLTLGIKKDSKNPVDHPRSYPIYYVVPPNKVDEDRGKDASTYTKILSERLKEEVRDAKIKLLSSLKQGTEEEQSAWKELSSALKSEYPKYTPLLSKILEGVLSRSRDEDKISHYEEVINAANEVIESIDKEELAKFFSVKNDPEDDEAEKIKKKMEMSRDQLTEALYQKGMALAEIETFNMKNVLVDPVESSKDPDGRNEDVQKCDDPSDSFEQNFKELRKWVDVKSSKYGLLLVMHEKRCGRLGTALKVLNDMIQDDSEPPKRKLYELKISLLVESGWPHLASYERRWMQVRFPAKLPLF